MARPQYGKWLEPEGLRLIEGWARNGLTDEQIAHNMGIAARTLYRWRDSHSQISQALKQGKDVVDLEVENALYKKATGFTGEDGKYYPPSDTAMIFWLKNRRPAAWRDKPAEPKESNGILSDLLELVRADD